MNESKPTNPKDIIGSTKIPVHLWPAAATALGSLGLLDGALKYGRTNWREAGVRFSIYADALQRHLMAKWEGIDIDPDSGLPQEAHMLACLAILVDAAEQGQLVDDRAYTKVPGWWKGFVINMTPHVKRLQEKYADREPHHWTIEDMSIDKPLEWLDQASEKQLRTPSRICTCAACTLWRERVAAQALDNPAAAAYG